MSSIKKQSIINAAITYTGVLIGFVSLLFIQPNLLKPEELGLTRILIAGASLIATVLPLGISSVTVKFFPYFRNEEKGHHGYFGFLLLFPLAGVIICGIFVYIFKNTIIAQYITQSYLFTQFFDLLLPFALIMGINMALNSYCSSLFKTNVISLFEGVITRLLFIALILVYYYQFIGLTQFVYCFVLIFALQALGMMMYIYTIDKPSLKIDRTHLRSVGLNKLIGFGLLLTITNMSSISLRHLDTIMIGKYISLEQVGVFSIAAYIALLIEIPLNSMERITNTKVSQAWANNDKESIINIYKSSVKYLMLIGGLLLIGIVTNIHDLLKLLPATYQAGVTVTMIACAGSFLNIATGVNTSILFSSPKYILGTILMVLMLAFAVLMNIYLIPKYGIKGAAISTALSIAIYNVVKFFIILLHFKMQPYDNSTLKILLTIALSFAAAYFIPIELENPILSMLLRGTLTVVVYGGMTVLLKTAPEFHKYVPFLKV